MCEAIPVEFSTLPITTVPALAIAGKEAIDVDGYSLLERCCRRRRRMAGGIRRKSAQKSMRTPGHPIGESQVLETQFLWVN